MSRSKWYYDHDGQTGGPVSVSQLRELAANGDLRPTDRVRKEDMDRWVKARAVKGLFTPADHSPPIATEPTEGDATFDFFGVGRPPAAAEPANEFHPAFDFFAGPQQPPAEVELLPVVPPPVPTSKPPSRSKPADVPLATPVRPPVANDSGTFQVIVPMAAPADFPADVPTAMPVSAIVSAATATADLTGPEVTLQPDGTARTTGGVVELSVTGGWLAARSAAPDGTTSETYLRLRRLIAVALRDRPGAGLVLSFHAGAEAVAVQCEGDAAPARAFLRRVLDTIE